MKESFRIYYPTDEAGKKYWNKHYGLNAYYAGKHHNKRNEDAYFWHALTKASMAKAQVRKRPFEHPVVITYRWNDRLDLSNHAMIAKMIEDAMKGRLIVDDSRRWVRGIEHYWHDAPYILVTVREVDRD